MIFKHVTKYIEMGSVNDRKDNRGLKSKDLPAILSASDVSGRTVLLCQIEHDLCEALKI